MSSGFFNEIHPVNFALQRPALTHRHALRLTPIASRNLWGFGSKTPAQSAPVSESAPPPPPSTFSEFDTTTAGASAPPDLPVTAAAPSDVLPDDIIPASPISDAVETLIGTAPLQYGDLAALGLASWTPAGLSAWLLELINVSTGLPWFWTIIAGTAASRLLILPFAIRQLQNSARLAPFQPRLLALKDEVARAYPSKDTIAIQRAALKQRKVYEDAGVSMLPMIAMPFIQLPITLGMFFGVKKLCTTPLAQLHDSGVWFLPDLTLADPYYILPIVSAALMNAQLSVGASDMAATTDRQTMAHMINAFRVLSLVGIPFMGYFPSGLNLYVLTGISAMLLQTSILKIHAVRRTLGIPILPKALKAKPVRIMESVDYLKKYIKEQRDIAEHRAARKW
ncbi:60Kd inner membrane protein-domain-containing protein [Amylostereum chailletii]|nr:60Kd inner membrane protein-domain-containing protein [Amylostereum chailletii]